MSAKVGDGQTVSVFQEEKKKKVRRVKAATDRKVNYPLQYHNKFPLQLEMRASIQLNHN